MSYSYYETYQLHQFDMTFSHKNEGHLSGKHVSSMFVFLSWFLVLHLVSFVKRLRLSAVSHIPSSDGRGFSLSSILLELLQRAVEEGKTPRVISNTLLHQHLSNFMFLTEHFFFHVFSSSVGGNPDKYSEEQELDLNYF